MVSAESCFLMCEGVRIKDDDYSSADQGQHIQHEIKDDAVVKRLDWKNVQKQN